ncbi:NUDIX domain-containing protein [Novosphingobium sp. BL-8H]|uniref:NUDIX domain-containing protein n=1 Tax=Novosphingobium sp. BL-8H TaxID=3127640 RepID=UPI0037566001
MAVWRVRRPRLEGVRVLAFDPAGRLLLLRHSYGSGKWMPPGGGMNRDEDALAAGKREFEEETGRPLLDGRELLAVDEDLQGASNRVHMVVGRVEGTPRWDGREIVEIALFPLDALPEAMPAGLARKIGEWVERMNAG